MLHSPDELRLVIQHVQLDPGARRLIDRVFDYTHRRRAPRDDVAARRRHADGRRPVRRQPADRAREPVHALSAGRAGDRSRRRLHPPQGHRQRAGVGQAAGVHARAGARTDLRLGRHAARMAAPRVPAAPRAHRHHPRPGPHVRRHRHAGGPAGGGGRRDPGRAGRRGDPAHRAQRRRQLRGRRATDAGRRGARDLASRSRRCRRRSRRWAASSSPSCPRTPVPGDVVSAGGFRFTVLAVRDRRIRRLHAVRLPMAETGAEAEAEPPPTSEG